MGSELPRGGRGSEGRSLRKARRSLLHLLSPARGRSTRGAGSTVAFFILPYCRAIARFGQVHALGCGETKGAQRTKEWKCAALTCKKQELCAATPSACRASAFPWQNPLTASSLRPCLVRAGGQYSFPFSRCSRFGSWLWRAIASPKAPP